MTNNVENILNDLVAIRTDAQEKGCQECVDYICDILQKNNVLFKRVASTDGRIENVIAGINIHEFKNIKTGLVFSGHIDTVGVNAKDWDTNPFIATNVNGLIYGRGTVDMKFFPAVLLSIIDELKKIDYPIFLLFTADEESTVDGIRTLTSFMQMRNIKPKFALLGEPTNFDLCVANKGYCGFSTIIKGLSAHSSRPDCGVNAIYVSAQIIAEIEKINNEYMPLGTTLNVGTIMGGVQRNSIPSETSFDWEIRFSNETHKLDIMERIEKLHRLLIKTNDHLYIRVLERENLPVFSRMENSRIVKVAGDLLSTNVITLPLATEAGFLQKLGIDTLICGAGDEKLAHSSSEHIKVTDLYKYRDFLLKFINEMQKEFI